MIDMNHASDVKDRTTDLQKERGERSVMETLRIKRQDWQTLIHLRSMSRIHHAHPYISCLLVAAEEDELRLGGEGEEEEGGEGEEDTHRGGRLLHDWWWVASLPALYSPRRGRVVSVYLRKFDRRRRDARRRRGAASRRIVRTLITRSTIIYYYTTQIVKDCCYSSFYLATNYFNWFPFI